MTLTVSLSQVGEKGADFQCWFHYSSELQVGQVSGTALPLTYLVVGTQGHSVTTELKLRGRERKRLSSVCSWGPWHTSWGLCSRQGPFGMKEQRWGVGVGTGCWLQGRDIQR